MDNAVRTDFCQSDYAEGAFQAEHVKTRTEVSVPRPRSLGEDVETGEETGMDLEAARRLGRELLGQHG